MEAAPPKGKDGKLYGNTINGGAQGYGTVFRLNPDGTGYQVLRSFSYVDGAVPSAGLLQGSDGTLYGRTQQGGSLYGLGTIFKLSPDGTQFQTLSQFSYPVGYAIGALIFGTDGGLYGTTEFGGVLGHGTIFRASIPPLISPISAPLSPVQVQSQVNASATFTGNCAPHTALWDWGDGTTSAGIVTEANGSGSVTGSHVYTAVGVYTLTLTVTDAAGNQGQRIFEFVVVYDPNAGFVTGGGWINSPAGAYTPNPNLSGKATFGFVSKYQKGASVPTGQTEFQFQMASFDFKSTDYQWLVIAGPKAQYKGHGTVNGVSGYSFMLTATDGEINGGGGVDKFRIHITNTSTGGTVYDNVPGAADDMNNASPEAIAGGDIVIHSN